MADGRHFENRYIAISVKNHPISMKFCTQQQILTGWTSCTRSCIGQTPSSTERISCCQKSHLILIAINRLMYDVYNNGRTSRAINSTVVACNRNDYCNAVRDPSVKFLFRLFLPPTVVFSRTLLRYVWLMAWAASVCRLSAVCRPANIGELSKGLYRIPFPFPAGAALP